MAPIYLNTNLVYHHFSHCYRYYQMEVMESEPLAEISFLYRCKLLRILNKLISLAVIKFVSEILNQSLSHWFPANRFLSLASMLRFDRTAV